MAKCSTPTTARLITDILRSALQRHCARQRKPKVSWTARVPDSLSWGSWAPSPRPTRRRVSADGFPRTIPQAEALGAILKKLGIKLDMVVSLEVPREVILDRLTTRRTCSNGACQEIYNIKSKPPGPGDKCLKCGSPVIQRADETVEAISKRLDTYQAMTRR
jgi:adenylate kinase